MPEIDTVNSPTTYPWWVGSSGQGVALRIKSFLALIIPALNLLLRNFGVNLLPEEVNLVIDSLFVVLFAVLQIVGWVRNILYRGKRMGRYVR